MPDKRHGLRCVYGVGGIIGRNTIAHLCGDVLYFIAESNGAFRAFCYVAIKYFFCSIIKQKSILNTFFKKIVIFALEKFKRYSFGNLLTSKETDSQLIDKP